ncbi:hypothetical protein IM792_12045 [Mucilaginibacter sp. JRF]|uniref:hypothetical protein n=1 Tax=Mucilaginibacter sp. JRF TaxID=2780088 RepID=UPI0018800FD2|nr:hypothetical protein [Mucilaginibacter sp. JRF]MBE9585182.1 hypothetical protein [Mucilaginibacter sp. JRF]
MPKLISKVQYKNYETGEFTNEQPRDLDETIALIKAFPWDDERHLTDIQLTGPSIIICNEADEYLKIGLYFNGKFALYYFDHKENLYEYYVPDLDKVTSIVRSFFQDDLDRNPFQKKFFSFGSEGHFLTHNFTYELNIYRWWFMALLGGTFTLFFAWVGIMVLYSSASVLAIFSIIPALMLYRSINNYIYAKDVKLNISKGKGYFYLYQKEIKTKIYKKDIEKIIISEIPFTDMPALLCSKIILKDGSSIKLSSNVIQPLTLIKKIKDVPHEFKFDVFPLLNRRSINIQNPIKF